MTSLSLSVSEFLKTWYDVDDGTTSIPTIVGDDGSEGGLLG